MMAGWITIDGYELRSLLHFIKKRTENRDSFLCRCSWRSREKNAKTDWKRMDESKDQDTDARVVVGDNQRANVERCRKLERNNVGAERSWRFSGSSVHLKAHSTVLSRRKELSRGVIVYIVLCFARL